MKRSTARRRYFLFVNHSKYSDGDILTLQTNISALLSLSRISMSQQPLVSCPQSLVLCIYDLTLGQIGIGVSGQNYRNSETAVSSLSRSIVQ